MNIVNYLCICTARDQDSAAHTIDVKDYPQAGCRIWSLNGVPVISTPAEIDMHNVDLLRHALDDAAANTAAVILDMTATGFCDAGTIGAIIPVATRMQMNGRELLLVVAAPQVMRVMEILDVGLYCRILPSLPAALVATQQVASAFDHAA